MKPKFLPINDESLCPTCGVGVLVPDTRDWVYHWDGHEVVIPSVTGLFCPSCDDVVTHGDDTRRLERLELEFRQLTVQRLRQLGK